MQQKVSSMKGPAARAGVAARMIPPSSSPDPQAAALNSAKRGQRAPVPGLQAVALERQHRPAEAEQRQGRQQRRQPAPGRQRRPEDPAEQAHHPQVDQRRQPAPPVEVPHQGQVDRAQVPAVVHGEREGGDPVHAVSKAGPRDPVGPGKVQVFNSLPAPQDPAARKSLAQAARTAE